MYRPDDRTCGRTSTEMESIASKITEIAYSLPRAATSAMQVALPKEGPPSGVVVLFSEVHAHANVQRNIAILIEHLAKSYDFRLVCVEGACGPGDLSLLWSIPYRTRMKFCEFLLGRAYLTGAELALALRPGIGVDLWGVDVASLYRLQWRAAKASLTMRPQARLQMVDFRKRLRRT